MEVFLPLVVGALNPSITFHSLGLLQLAPQFTPAHSPVCSSSLPPCPIAPYIPQVVGTPTHTWPLGVSWEQAGNELEWAGSELELAGRWEWAGASGEQAGSKLEWAGSKLEWGRSKGSQLQLAPMLPPSPLPPEVVETAIHSKLFIGHWEWGLVSWEWGEWQQWLGIEGSDLGVRGASFSFLPPCPLALCPPEVVGTQIHTKLFIGIWEQAGVSWEQAGVSWSELGSWSKLGVRWEQAGASWEAGESWSKLEQAERLERAGTKLGVSWSKLGGWRELGVSWERAAVSWEWAGVSWSKTGARGVIWEWRDPASACSHFRTTTPSLSEIFSVIVAWLYVLAFQDQTPSQSEIFSELAPACSQLAPSCSSLLPSLLQLAPTLPNSPLHTTGGGDPNTYMAIGSELEWAGS